MLNGFRWDWSAMWSDEQEAEAYALDAERTGRRATETGDDFLARLIFGEAPIGSTEESVREDAKWDRDDEPETDEDDER